MLESPDIRQEYLSCLQSLKSADVVAHDVKDDLKRGGAMAVTELMRRMTTASEDILAHCVARGMNPGCSDRKLIVVVFEILREFEGYRSPLSVDHYLKPAHYLKGKFQVIQKFARYLKIMKDKDLSHAESDARPHKRLSELTKDTASSRAHRAYSPTSRPGLYFEEVPEYEASSSATEAEIEEAELEPVQGMGAGFLLNRASAHSNPKPSRRVTHTGAMGTDITELRTPFATEKSSSSSSHEAGDTEETALDQGKNDSEEELDGPVSGHMMKDMEKQFADSQSMMRMILSLSKRIRSLEDYGGTLDSVANTSSLMHTAPHKQKSPSPSKAGGDTSKATPTRGIHASPSRTASYRKSVNGATSPNKKASLGEALYGAAVDGNKIDIGGGDEEPLAVSSAEIAMGMAMGAGAGVGVGQAGGNAGGNGTNEELGTAYIDLLFSLLEKKMRANLESEIRSAVNSAVAVSEKRSAEQMRMLVSEIDKIHGNFDQRLTKLETSMARDKIEKRMEEQEMGKLIANSVYSPSSNIARFRMTQALSQAPPAPR